MSPKAVIAGMIPACILAGLGVYFDRAIEHARLYGPYTATYRKIDEYHYQWLFRQEKEHRMNYEQCREKDPKRAGRIVEDAESCRQQRLDLEQSTRLRVEKEMFRGEKEGDPIQWGWRPDKEKGLTSVEYGNLTRPREPR